MDLSERVSKDVIKIFHNAKGSISKDVLRWTQTIHDTNQDARQATELLEAHGGVSMAKENKREENPSIFGTQPVSEYSQQPFPSQNHHENVEPKEEENITGATLDEQSTKEEEERSKLEGLKRDEDIEQRRSEYGGFIGSQR